MTLDPKIHALAASAARWFAEQLRTDPDARYMFGGPYGAGTDKLGWILAALDPSRTPREWHDWLREGAVPRHRRGTGHIAEGDRARHAAECHWSYDADCDCPWCTGEHGEGCDCERCEAEEEEP